MSTFVATIDRLCFSLTYLFRFATASERYSQLRRISSPKLKDIRVSTSSDEYLPHLDKIRDLYRHKCNLMLDAMDKYFPKTVKYTRPEGGLFLWCTLPEGRDLGEFVAEALANKVAVVPGTAFNCDTLAPSNSFRLNYSTPSDAQILHGIEILGSIL